MVGIVHRSWLESKFARYYHHMFPAQGEVPSCKLSIIHRGVTIGQDYLVVFGFLASWVKLLVFNIFLV